MSALSRPLNPALWVVSRHSFLFLSPGLLSPPCHDFWYRFKLTHSNNNLLTNHPPTEEREAEGVGGGNLNISGYLAQGYLGSGPRMSQHLLHFSILHWISANISQGRLISCSAFYLPPVPTRQTWISEGHYRLFSTPPTRSQSCSINSSEYSTSINSYKV